MEQFTAIQTEYNGYLFRSRLEARWAVFFDAMGIEYEYEPEGIVLSDGSLYLLDFYLPDFRCYFEVKRKSVKGTEKEKIAMAKISNGSRTDSWQALSVSEIRWTMTSISSVRKLMMEVAAAMRTRSLSVSTRILMSLTFLLITTDVREAFLIASVRTWILSRC
jgi:hypothetical protein